MRTLALLALFLLGTTTTFANTKITYLRCEYLESPLGIDSRQPRLSWNIESDERGQTQTAYQVLVASSQSRLRKNEGDVWDSGKVKGDSIAQISVAGKPLESARRYYWKVRSWGRDGKPSAYSRPAYWEMGLLSPQDWRGSWIGRTEEIKYTPAPLLRRAFSLNKPIRQARVFVSGVGYYELRINGHKIGDGVRDPGYTRFDRRVLYNTYDVTSLLGEGGNVLGVILGTGFLNPHVRAVWDFDRAPWRQSPRLLLELRVIYQDGTTERIVTDNQWRTTASPITFDGIHGGEFYDARLEKEGWDAPSYDDSAWEPVKVLSAPGGILKSAQMPSVQVTQTRRPAKISQPKPGIYLLDMGQNLAGNAILTVQGTEGTAVKLEYGERLNPNGTLNTEHIGGFVKNTDKTQPFQTEVYTLKGGGKEVWSSRFTYHGFQYIQVTGYPGKLTSESVQAQFAHSAITPTGTFTCSNPLLNKIWKAGIYAYLSNLQSIPTDCPHREKNGWTGDAHLAAEQGLFNFDPAPVYTKWVNDLDDEMQDSGALPGIVPSSGWGYVWGNGPAWDSAFLLIPYYMYTYLGDAQILKEHYPKMRRYVDYLTRHANNGIVTLGLGDWAPFETETPVDVTSTGYYYRDTLIVAKTAELLGKTQEASDYYALAESIKKGFLEKFYNPMTGLIANGSQTAQSCALYQGLTTPENHDRILTNLLSTVQNSKGHIDTGILGAKYLLNGLLENGRADIAYQVASQKTLPSWGYWIENGATTLYESWRDTDSRNHIMYGDILAWMYKALAGIVPETEHPGFSHFTLKPYPVGDLTSAKAEYRSIRGLIESDWKREGDKFTWKVTIPPTSTARVCVPVFSSGAMVLEGKKPLGDNPQLKVIGVHNGYVEMEAESGTYLFTVK